MIRLNVDLSDQSNKQWAEALCPDGITIPEHGVLTRIGLLESGTVEGRHTVSMAIKLDSGLIVFAEQTCRNLLSLFEAEHLPEGFIRETSLICGVLANTMVEYFPDGPELTTGLRKLLEAKDCFVRCAVIEARKDKEW